MLLTTAHLNRLLELAEEVLLQAVSEVGREFSPAVDAEGGRQRRPQTLHECIPLSLRHDPLRTHEDCGAEPEMGVLS